VDCPGLLRLERQRDVFGTDTLQVGNHRPASGCYETDPPLRSNRRGDIDRAALDPAGNQLRQDLQDDRRNSATRRGLRTRDCLIC